MMVPLVVCGNSTTVQIVSLLGGKGLRRKLMTMGMMPGSFWRVVQNFHGGPIILENNETRIGIGQGMAQKILVKIVR